MYRSLGNVVGRITAVNATFGEEWRSHQGSLMRLPKCGARTRKGIPCKRVAVKGAGRCQLHGGGGILLQRYRNELASARSVRRREWLLERLGRASQNAETKYLASGKWVREARARAAELEPKILAAIREGQCTREVLARWLGAVAQIRPYRDEIARPVVYEALLGMHGPIWIGAGAVAGSLALNERERATLFARLGLRGLGG